LSSKLRNCSSFVTCKAASGYRFPPGPVTAEILAPSIKTREKLTIESTVSKAYSLEDLDPRWQADFQCHNILAFAWRPSEDRGARVLPGHPIANGRKKNVKKLIN